MSKTLCRALILALGALAALPAIAPAACTPTFLKLLDKPVTVHSGHWDMTAEPLLIGCKEDLDHIGARGLAELRNAFKDNFSKCSLMALASNDQLAARRLCFLDPLNQKLKKPVITDIYLADLNGKEEK